MNKPAQLARRRPGTGNLRDLGGIRVRGGRRVASGKVLRSAAPERLPAEDIAMLEALSVRCICDLRRPQELREASSRWRGDKPLRVHFPVIADHPGSIGELIYDMMSDPLGQACREHMFAIYRELPRGFAPWLARFIELLLEPGGTPLLLHCTEGKDRTGFVCAVLLLALGAEREDVFEDYLLSRAMFDREALREALSGMLPRPLPGELTDAAIDGLAVNTLYLEAALEEIERGWGSVDAYVEREGALDAVRRRALEELLLE